MLKFFPIWILPLVLLSCGPSDKQEENTDSSELDLSAGKWPKKTPIQAKARSILNDWPEFSRMETSFDAIYTVENIEDLKLVIDDLIDKQNLLADSEYPESFDLPRIKSRQKVFKTYILKTKNYLEFQRNPEESILEMIDAYNVFRDHFNIIINNTLDTQLILEEQ